jgi:heme/copper-type cytochrome/quinol oxidase subunit 2
VYNLIFNNDFSETRLLEFIYRNLTLTNILLPTAYVFNAMSVSSDILPSLVWLGMNNHISFLFYILVVSGWLVMYLSSHSDKSFDNKDDNYIFPIFIFHSKILNLK